MADNPTPVETSADAGSAPHVPRAIEVLVPVVFIGCFAWVVWNGPAFLMTFRDAGPAVDALARRYGEVSALDWLALAASLALFVLGVATVRRAPSEWQDWGIFDRVSVFIGRVTMALVMVLVGVMAFEVMARYVFERPTIWANEMSLWLAGFVFVLAGLYAMQQRCHIRIFLLYDLFPRWLQRVCDCISVALICLFAAALCYGAWGEARDKFMRWETFGTAFDPPIPATLKPMILLIVVLVAIQAIANLIRDWNAEPVIHSAADDIDPDELERLRRSVGSD